MDRKPINALPAGSVLVNGEKRYTVVRTLGAGGFGITYQVKRTVDGVPVSFAVKEFFISDVCERDATQSLVYPSPSRSRVESSLRDFVTEAGRLRDNGLHHPNVVSVSDVFKANNTAYYVMEYVEGESLSATIKGRGGKPFDEGTALAMMRGVLSALAELHDHRITHLDIKPENILLERGSSGDGTERPVIIDFGLSKHYDDCGEATSTIAGAGYSSGFSPIEQYAVLARFTPQADVYSSAATLYYVLTGRRPRPAMEVDLAEIASDLRRHGVTENTRQAIVRAMAMLKANRTPSIRQFAADLGLSLGSYGRMPQAKEAYADCTIAVAGADDTVVSGGGHHDTVSVGSVASDTVRTAGPLPPPPKRGSGRPWMKVAAVVALFVAVVVALILGLSGGESEAGAVAQDSLVRDKESATAQSEPLATVEEGDDKITREWSTHIDENSNLKGFLDAYGNVAIPATFDEVWHFAEGLAPVEVSGKRGYINKNGKFVIEPAYDFARWFSEGLAVVRPDENGKFGYIDKSGRMVIEPQYDSAFDFSEELARVKKDGETFYIDKQNRVAIPPQEGMVYTGEFSDGLADFKKDRKYGFIDKQGRVVIEPKYGYVPGFSEGLSPASNGNGLGFIDKTGKLVIPHKFVQVGGFHEGLSWAVVGTVNEPKYGYIDHSGKFVIKPVYDCGGHFSHGLAFVTKNGETGFIDKSGKFYPGKEYEVRRLLERK